MAPIDHAGRARAELRLQEEQTYELITRQRHDNVTRLYANTEGDRTEAVAAGQRAQHQMQQTYQDADRFVAGKQQVVAKAVHEAEQMKQVAQKREGIVRLFENEPARVNECFTDYEDRARQEFLRIN